jgi:hypothetical protein
MESGDITFGLKKGWKPVGIFKAKGHVVEVLYQSQLLRCKGTIFVDEVIVEWIPLL